MARQTGTCFSHVFVYVVVAVFLLCWAPFFTVNIVNAVCILYTATCDSASSEDCRRSLRVNSATTLD